MDISGMACAIAIIAIIAIIAMLLIKLFMCNEKKEEEKEFDWIGHYKQSGPMPQGIPENKNTQNALIRRLVELFPKFSSRFKYWVIPDCSLCSNVFDIMRRKGISRRHVIHLHDGEYLFLLKEIDEAQRLNLILDLNECLAQSSNVGNSVLDNRILEAIITAVEESDK